MGPPKDRFRDFSIAFWKTARDDLERAEDAMIERVYSYAVFHSQQSVEKIVKALLEKKEVFTRDHDVSDLFTVYILNPEKWDTIAHGSAKSIKISIPGTNPPAFFTAISF